MTSSFFILMKINTFFHALFCRLNLLLFILIHKNIKYYYIYLYKCIYNIININLKLIKIDQYF